MEIKVTILIPARGGSKRVPKKNVKKLKGKPLIAHSIESALKSKVDEVWVSTDDEEIKNISLKYGAKVLDRPSELATDYSSTEEAIEHFLNNVSCDILMILEATYPQITTNDINNMINSFFSSDCNSSVGLEVRKDFLWDINQKYAKPINYNPLSRSRLQDFEGIYIESGMWITTRIAFLKSKCRISGKIDYYVIPHSCIDIDEERDFKILETLID